MRLSRADHLAELEIAEDHLARGEKLIEEQKARMRRLAAGGGSISRDSDKLLSLLDLSQKLFEDHVILIKRELEQGE
jgi:hypothetical protein